MYEQEVLNYLEQIEENTQSQHLQLIYLVDNAQLMNEYTQEIISGDKQMLTKIEENTNGIIMINMILIITLLFTFIMRCLK